MSKSSMIGWIIGTSAVFYMLGAFNGSVFLPKDSTPLLKKLDQTTIINQQSHIEFYELKNNDLKCLVSMTILPQGTVPQINCK